jgi:hypothetical protein
MAKLPAGEALLVAGASALGLFILSGGLYAGVTGVTRRVTLVTGLVAVAVAAVLITMYAWTASHRSRR